MPVFARRDPNCPGALHERSSGFLCCGGLYPRSPVTARGTHRLPAWWDWKITLGCIALVAVTVLLALTIHWVRENAIERLETKLEARLDALERTVADLPDAAATR